jgi:putative DNA primase/helicase
MPTTNGWPEPAVLRSAIPAAQVLDLKLLPKVLQPMVKDVSERMSTPPDMAAAAAVACLGACVNRRAVIQPDSTGWQVTPCIWAGVIGAPGVLKTPTLNAFTKPLRGFQDIWFEQYESELKIYQVEADKWRLKKQAHDEMYKAWLKNPAKGEPKPLEEPPTPPICRRLLVNDSTPEKLHLMLSENPAGLFLQLDEMVNWLASLDKPGYETARTFFLTCWAVSGDSKFTLDRIGRGTITANVCLSLLGGIQPDMLRSYLGGVNDSDGLLQRLQVLVWPEAVPYRKAERQPDEIALHQIEHAFENLLSIDPATPLEFKFSPGAQGVFDRWRAALEDKIRDPNMDSALSGHLSKYRSLMPALALLFELVDRKKASSNYHVSTEHTTQAVAFCSYLESHARKVYWHLTARNGVEVSAHELSKHLNQGDLGSAFTVRQVYRNDWSGLKNVGNVKAACEELVDAGWLRTRDSFKTAEGLGNPVLFELHLKKAKYDYVVNPKVWEPLSAA